MLRTIGKTFGIAMISLCLAAPLALAQPQSPTQPMGGQPMTCTKVDTSGFCIEAKGADDKMMTVRVEGVKVDEKMTCVTSGTTTTCTKVTKTQ
jgi:hypothetical protein